ncbi:MAG: 4-hydroxy-2-oxovalerate aldolase [bacterium]|nr:4-hydroxy-2-oxovalerate aldolase [bacterium]
MKTKILDTTIRDGSYAVNFKFTRTDVRNVVSRLSKLNIEYVEIGHGMGLNASSPERGVSLYSDEEYIRVAKECIGNGKLGVFCIPGIARFEDVKNAKAQGVDFIRIGVTVQCVDKAIPYIQLAKEIGLIVMVNFMKSYAASPQEFAKSCHIAHQHGADYVYLVDSAGTMLPEDIENFYHSAVELTPNIQLGFHGHNNMGLGVANGLKCMELGFAFVDCSFQGLGRSIGNIPTEMFVMAAKKKYGANVYDIDLPRLLEYGYVVLKDISDRNLNNPLELICGYTGFHSSFLKHIYHCCCEYNVDPLRLIMAYSEIDKESIDDEKLAQVAKSLPIDNFDEHPYNFRNYFSNNL